MWTGARAGKSSTLCHGILSHHYKAKIVIASLSNKLHCVPIKNIPNLLNCNLRKDYRIVTNFVRNITDTTGHQTIIQFPTSSKVCFCTPCDKQNQHIPGGAKKNVPNLA